MAIGGYYMAIRRHNSRFKKYPYVAMWPMVLDPKLDSSGIRVGGLEMATLTAVRQHSGKRISFPGITRPSVSAGTTVFLSYIFAGLTVQVGVLTQLGIGGPEASSWFFITWMTTGLFSLVLSLVTKQPVSINLSIAAMVFIAGSASGFSLAQILGANLVVGIVAMALSLLRLTDAFARIVPPQIAIGVFAGTVMAFMLKTSLRAIDDPISSAPVIASRSCRALLALA